MSDDEKVCWVIWLWMSSVVMTLWIGVGFGSGEWHGPLIVGGFMFAIGAIIWLFRVTYLAGQKR